MRYANRFLHQGRVGRQHDRLFADGVQKCQLAGVQRDGVARGVCRTVFCVAVDRMAVMGATAREADGVGRSSVGVRAR